MTTLSESRMRGTRPSGSTSGSVETHDGPLGEVGSERGGLQSAPPALYVTRHLSTLLNATMGPSTSVIQRWRADERMREWVSVAQWPGSLLPERP
jgi:hypothetical protein